MHNYRSLLYYSYNYFIIILRVANRLAVNKFKTQIHMYIDDIHFLNLYVQNTKLSDEDNL
jgi:hypothetical protein